MQKKIKSFECPKSIKNYEKKIMLGTSDAWSMSRLSHRPSEPAYYILKIVGFLVIKSDIEVTQSFTIKFEKTSM